METVRERQSCDWQLLLVTVLLLILGLAVVLDASWARAEASKMYGNDGFYFFKKQLQWGVIALAALSVTLRLPYWRLRDWRIWGTGVALSFALLVLVLIVGREINGSKRWLPLGPVGFQPSEFAKVAMVLFLARYSELWRGRVQHLTKGFLPAVLVVLGIGGLVAKEDLGTALVVVGTGLAMILMMGARMRHMAGLVGLCIGAVVLLVIIEPYRIERIQAWLTLLADPVARHDGPAYQPAQGLIAVGSGGLLGQGIMFGTAKYRYLPAEHTDYILATVGEEVGLAGCLVLLGLFTWLIIRGLTIAHRTRDWFGSLLAAGFTTMIGLQVILNVAVVTSLVPCTGVPLPFISYGGSSLVFTVVSIGLILGISQYPSGPPAEAREKPHRESHTDGWRNRRPHLSRS